MKKFVLLLFFFLAPGPWTLAPSAFADVGIEATVNPSRGNVGEPMTLTIIVNGVTSGIRTPQLPKLVNFRSYARGSSQEMSFVNGTMSSRSVFSYVLVPTLPGKHVLGQIDVPIGEKVYKTGVLEVEVFDGSVPPPSAGSGYRPALVSPAPGPVSAPATRSLPPEYMAGKDIFVRAWADKEDVYVNEPIYLTYTVYTRVSATFKGFDKEPDTTGFWVEEFPPQGTVRRQEKEIGGWRYVVADVRTVALFPQEPGRFTLDPGTLNVDVEIQQSDSFDTFYSSDLFGIRSYRRPRSIITQVVPKLVTTDPIVVNVKPLPEEGKPADFKGAVGRYTLGASLDRMKVEEGQPVTYKLKLTGEGNLNVVELPKLPELDYFKQYDSSSSLNTHKERLVVEGDKISETVLIPKKAGTFTIPAVSFSYFDPRFKTYETLKTQPLAVTVTESDTEESPPPVSLGPGVQPQAVGLLGEDIRFIKTRRGVLGPERPPLVLRPFYWMANAALLLLALLALVLKTALDHTGRDAEGVRFRRSHKVARSRLKTARSHLKRGSEKAFYESLAQAMNGYFADKLGLEPGEVGLTPVEERLAARVPEEDLKLLGDVWAAVDFGRFGRSDSGVDEMKKLYESADDLITRLEGRKI